MRHFNTKKLRYVFLFLVLLLSACSTSKDPSTSKMTSDEKLFHVGERALAKGYYKQAIDSFEALDTQFPFSKYAEQSQKNIIYAYYKAGEHASVIASADRFIHVYPRSKNVDYAYYMRGVSNTLVDRNLTQRYFPIDVSLRDLKSERKAFSDFNELVRRFPESQYTVDARQRMVHLRNLFAEHETHVAEYYFKRKAFVAAANRASYVIQHYQQSPSVTEALTLLKKSYAELELSEAVGEVENVQEMNPS